MIPLILYGNTKEGRAKEVAVRFPPDQYIVTHIVAEKTSILIGQIHNLIKELSITSSHQRLIWVEEANTMTLPAQNALLKTLEEPPQNTQFILTLSNPQSLLPTICSRCRLLKVKEEKIALDGIALSDIKRALSLSAGDRILAADAIGRKREVALEWTTKCLSDLVVKMKNEKSTKALGILTNIASAVHTAHLDLQSNISVGLTMQNLFLNLPRTKN